MSGSAPVQITSSRGASVGVGSGVSVGFAIIAVLVVFVVGVDVGVSGMGAGVSILVQATMIAKGKVSKKRTLAIFSSARIHVLKYLVLIIAH